MKRLGTERTNGERLPRDSPPVIGPPPQSSTVQPSYRHKSVVGVHPHLRVIVCDLHEAIISSESVSPSLVCLLYSPSTLGHVSLGGLRVPHMHESERRPSIAIRRFHSTPPKPTPRGYDQYNAKPVLGVQTIATRKHTWIFSEACGPQ